MNLTPEEIELIKNHRRIKAEKKDREKQTLHLLLVAGGYLEWLQENGRQSSFSTFIDEYGFQGNFGRWSPSAFYEKILDLIQLANE